MRKTGITLLLSSLVIVAAILLHTLVNTTVSFYILVITCIFLLAHLRATQRRIREFFNRVLGKSPAVPYNFEHVETAWQRQAQSLEQIIEAIDKVGEDDLHLSQVTQLEGEAGKAISNLRSKLGRLKVQEQRRVWAAQGIASIGEIRKNNADLQEYSYQILSHLVKYIEANQGAFYVLHDDNTLELLSTYAYGRRKYTNEKVTVNPGSGIVGQCVLERQMIFMTDIPVNYVRITSGLGEATPRCVVVAPLQYRDEVFGVIEIASFKKLPEDTLEFVQAKPAKRLPWNFPAFVPRRARGNFWNNHKKKNCAKVWPKCVARNAICCERKKS